MKKLILLVGICFLITSCSDKTEKNIKVNLGIVKIDSIFHIKAKYWYACQWQVIFTNTNFYEEENIMNCWDASSKFTGNDIVNQLMIFDNEEEAVRFAKKFKNYAMCKRWNDSIESKVIQLTIFRNNNTIIKEDDAAPPACKNDVGKEVLVR